MKLEDFFVAWREGLRNCASNTATKAVREVPL